MSNAAASLDPSDLPDDPAALKALLVAERGLRADLACEVARLTAIVQAFKRAMFGKRAPRSSIRRSSNWLWKTRSRSSLRRGRRRMPLIRP